MNQIIEPPELPLSQALILWCDEEIAQQMLKAQSYFSDVALRGAGYFPFLVENQSRCRSRYVDFRQGAHEAKLLKHAWAKLLNNFRARVQDCSLYLRGTQTSPKLHDYLSAIPNAWGHDLEFDLFKDAVRVALRCRYIGVRVSKSPIVDPATPFAPPTQISITPACIPELSDEIVLELLEEHAKRVVENDGRMIAPGKISLMPIIKRKMLHRKETGELQQTLAAESRDLARWIATKAPSHQVPTAGTIKNAMSQHYPRGKA